MKKPAEANNRSYLKLTILHNNRRQWDNNIHKCADMYFHVCNECNEDDDFYHGSVTDVKYKALSFALPGNKL